MGIGQSGDEIHRYRGEWDRGFYFQRGESRRHEVSVHLGCLAIGTLQDEPLEESRHSRPPIVLLHAVECAKESFMSSSWGFIEGFYEIEVGRMGM